MPKLKAIQQIAALKERYLAPCQAACPVHTNAREYVTLVGEGRFKEAFLVARGPNPFAAVCGRACSAPCEDVCTRGEFGRPVSIRKLKRFLTDRFEAHIPGAKAAPTGLRVAVVGAGPAGLAAAQDLALLGHAVTVFEAAQAPGGMALLGVPRFRLAGAAIERDVAAIQAMGVEIRTGVRVGRDLLLEDLRRDFQAVLVATGTMRLNGLEAPGTDLAGVVQAIPFLEEANLGGRPACGERVAVIGGGYTAMDAARTAVRLGAKQVAVLYRRTRTETEVHDEELEETLHEGASIHYLISPMRIIDDGEGRVRGIELVRNRLGEPDASGRPRPVPVAGSEFVFDADMVILAIGQSPDPAGVDHGLAAQLRSVDPETGMTPIEGVFSGGDFVDGASTIIEAVAGGRKAAAAIQRFLERNHGAGASWPAAPEAWSVTTSNGARPLGRVLSGLNLASNGHAPAELSLEAEVEGTFTEAMAVSEGLRCLFCGVLPVVVLDECTACQACVSVCPTDALYAVALERPSGVGSVVAYQVNPEACIKCGRCVGECPVDCIVPA